MRLMRSPTEAFCVDVVAGMPAAWRRCSKFVVQTVGPQRKTSRSATSGTQCRSAASSSPLAAGPRTESGKGRGPPKARSCRPFSPGKRPHRARGQAAGRQPDRDPARRRPAVSVGSRMRAPAGAGPPTAAGLQPRNLLDRVFADASDEGVVDTYVHYLRRKLASGDPDCTRYRLSARTLMRAKSR